MRGAPDNVYVPFRLSEIFDLMHALDARWELDIDNDEKMRLAALGDRLRHAKQAAMMRRDASVIEAGLRKEE